MLFFLLFLELLLKRPSGFLFFFIYLRKNDAGRRQESFYFYFRFFIGACVERHNCGTLLDNKKKKMFYSLDAVGGRYRRKRRRRSGCARARDASRRPDARRDGALSLFRASPSPRVRRSLPSPVGSCGDAAPPGRRGAPRSRTASPIDAHPAPADVHVIRSLHQLPRHVISATERHVLNGPLFASDNGRLAPVTLRRPGGTSIKRIGTHTVLESGLRLARFIPLFRHLALLFRPLTVSESLGASETHRTRRDRFSLGSGSGN